MADTKTYVEKPLCPYCHFRRDVVLYDVEEGFLFYRCEGCVVELAVFPDGQVWAY